MSCRPNGRYRLTSLAAISSLALLLPWAPSHGINIVLNYNNASSVEPAADPTGAILTSLFQHAESFYQDVFEDTHTLTINFWWENLNSGTLGVHSLVSQSGGRETVANIRIDNNTSWFLDPTPANDSEFNMSQTLWRDLSGSQQSNFYNNFGSNIPDTFEVGYTGSAVGGGPAVGVFDAVSVVLHEVGHALGMSSANTSTQAETGDGDYDFNSAFVFGQSLAAEVASGNNIAHLDNSSAIMFPSFGSGTRRLPSHTDLFAMASGHSYVNLDVPRREFYAGTADWNTDGNWSGDTDPGIFDDVFVRDNNGASTSTVTAGLSANGFAANLFVGEAANVDTNANLLLVDFTATVDGVDSDIIINPSGELDADHVIIQNQAEIFMTGGLLDTNTMQIDDGTLLRKGTGGPATVNVQNDLNNNGTIQGGGGDTLTLESTGGAVWDLDGTSGNGIVRAETGDVNIASGSLSDGFDGDMFIGNGSANPRTLTIAQPWTLGSGGVINMEGETSTNRAALNGGTMTSTAGEINALAGVSHVNAPVDLGGSFNANVSDGATLEFNGNVDVSGGDFLAVGTGRVDFDGTTTYSGGTVDFTGTLHQDGNATVTADTTINGEIYNFDGGGAISHTFTLNNDLTLNVDEIDDVGESFDSTLNINGSGSELTVNTPNPWTLGGVTNIDTNTTLTAPSISGSDVDMTGTINIDGGTRFDATVRITGTINFADSTSRLNLNGGNLPDTNRIAGGTVNGPAGSTLRSTTGSSLEGFGTINSDVDFLSDTFLLADNGTLQINGAFVDLGTIGTADSDGILEVTNAWNTGIATELQLNGGQVIGAAITNDGTTTGFGTIASASFNNSGTVSANGGTLILNTPTFPDLDGSSEVGVINAVNGNVQVIPGGGSFAFNGTVNVGTGREFRMDTNGLRNQVGGTVNLTRGAVVVTEFEQSAALNVNAGGTSLIQAAVIDFTASGNNVLNDDLRVRGAARIFSGANFSGPGRVIVSSGSTLNIQDGTSTAVSVANEGRTAVGFSTGLARIAAFEQSNNATYEVEIDGTTVGSRYDQLQVVGNATLDGTLEILLNQNGGVYADPAVPGTVDEFVLLVAGSLTGSFDDVIYDGVTLVPEFGVAADGDFEDHVGAGLFRLVDYSPSDMRFLNYKALPGDANGDGNVDGTDFGIWNSNKFLAGTDWTTGDFNGDGLTDGSDFGIWNINKFTNIPLALLGGAAASGDFAISAIPEPACGAVFLMGLVLAVRRKR